MTWPKWHQSETFVGVLTNVFLLNCSCPLCFKDHNFLLGGLWVSLRLIVHNSKNEVQQFEDTLKKFKVD